MKPGAGSGRTVDARCLTERAGSPVTRSLCRFSPPSVAACVFKEQDWSEWLSEQSWCWRELGKMTVSTSVFSRPTPPAEEDNAHLSPGWQDSPLTHTHTLIVMKHLSQSTLHRCWILCVCVCVCYYHLNFEFNCLLSILSTIVDK